jgi:outer membrane protein OmpA-like peptidoglycan-associated protein
MKRTTLSSLLLGSIVGGALLLASLPGCQASGSGSLNMGGGTPANSATPPAGAPADVDSDGVADGDDKCKDKKEDGLPPDAKDGCPSEDPDQDGVLGAADKCPDKAETKNGFEDEDGCPDEAPVSHVKVSGDRIEITEEIKFVTGSAEIDHASDKLLAEIADAIKKNPDIDFMEIAGHTDSRGAAAANKTLSQKRAESVMNELAKDGVDKAKMRAVGYGPYCLKEAADTEEAHTKNRRVEFDILRRGGKDLATKWGGCEGAEKKGMKPLPLPQPAAAAAPAAAPAKKLSPQGADTQCPGGALPSLRERR